MRNFGYGQVGRPPGTLTVQVPYADPAALSGLSGGLGMVDPSEWWNYGRDDGLSPVPAQPMAFLPGPAPPTLLGGFGAAQVSLLGNSGPGGILSYVDPRSGIQLFGPTPQLLGDPGWAAAHPKSVIGIITSVMAGAAAGGAAIAASRGGRLRAAGGGAVAGAGLGLALAIIYGLSS